MKNLTFAVVEQNQGGMGTRRRQKNNRQDATPGAAMPGINANGFGRTHLNRRMQCGRNFR